MSDSPVVLRGSLGLSIPTHDVVVSAPPTTSISPEYPLADGTPFHHFLRSDTLKRAEPVFSTAQTQVYNIHDNFVIKAVRNPQLYENEVTMLSRFRGKPYVTQIIAALWDNGFGYILMRIEHGRTFAQFLKEPDRHRQQIYMDILYGLFEIHKSGVVHRDVKPANIWVPYDVRKPTYLIDFGISKEIGTPNPLTGTPQYLPPWRSPTVDEDVDFYALGEILKAHPISAESAAIVALLQTPGITQEALSPREGHPGVVIKGGKRTLHVKRKRGTRRLRRRRFTSA